MAFRYATAAGRTICSFPRSPYQLLPWRALSARLPCSQHAATTCPLHARPLSARLPQALLLIRRDWRAGALHVPRRVSRHVSRHVSWHAEGTGAASCRSWNLRILAMLSCYRYTIVYMPYDPCKKLASWARIQGTVICYDRQLITIDG